MNPPSTTSHHPGRKSRNPGFTLVELLVVIVIVVALASVIFNALMPDGSVQAVTESAEAFNKWKSGI